MNHHAEHGAMAALLTSEETVKTLIQDCDLADDITISVYNSEQNHVVSGERPALDRLLQVAQASGVKTIRLKVTAGATLSRHDYPHVTDPEQDSIAHASRSRYLPSESGYRIMRLNWGRLQFRSIRLTWAVSLELIRGSIQNFG